MGDPINDGIRRLSLRVTALEDKLDQVRKWCDREFYDLEHYSNGEPRYWHVLVGPVDDLFKLLGMRKPSHKNPCAKHRKARDGDTVHVCSECGELVVFM